MIILHLPHFFFFIKKHGLIIAQFDIEFLIQQMMNLNF